ncbi:lactonase family protein [Cohnella pontilimi]|uniref:lactonase family protein n=1 Tax=Cohnella pontilimi TaxID=2564100 RepID=UPI001B8075E4|nr:lactonase family protein [Cohnella pontilimi]
MQNRTWELWIGSYAKPDEAGITRVEMDAATGEWVKTAEYGGIENPSFLAMNRDGSVLYAVSETMETDGQPGGRMIAYPVAPDMRKLEAGWERLTHGAAPCHLMLDPEERWLAVANYAGAAVTLYPLHTDGKPGEAMVRLRHAGSGPNPQRQEAPHPHAAVFGPEGGQYLFVPDLGLDHVMIYKQGEGGSEWTGHGTAPLSPGDGPRHLAFHPDGRSAYVVNELSNTITRFSYPEPGKLQREETLSTLPAGFTGESTCAEVAVSPDGRFVYVSNRGHDSIAIFQINASTGQLEAAGHVSTRGRNPRHFTLTPDGEWLIAAHQDTNNLVLFRLDKQSGLPIYQGVELSVNKPVCVLIRLLE